MAQCFEQTESTWWIYEYIREVWMFSNKLQIQIHKQQLLKLNILKNNSNIWQQYIYIWQQ